MKIPNAFYRVSVKALILNEKNEFLLAKEKSGFWELLGGGMDFGENPTDALRREISEETGLDVASIEATPTYFLTDKSRSNTWIANVIYKVTLVNLDFKTSDECIELRYFTKETLKKEDSLTNVIKFAEMFNKRNHE